MIIVLPQLVVACYICYVFINFNSIIMKKTKLIFSLLTVIALFITSCGSGEKKQEVTETAIEEVSEAQGQSTVSDDVSAANALQVAKSIEDFSTLVAAIEAAGVEDAVVNVGPLTIFAPVNAAFDKLPEGDFLARFYGNKDILALLKQTFIQRDSYYGNSNIALSYLLNDSELESIFYSSRRRIRKIHKLYKKAEESLDDDLKLLLKLN